MKKLSRKKLHNWLNDFVLICLEVSNYEQGVDILAGKVGLFVPSLVFEVLKKYAVVEQAGNANVYFIEATFGKGNSCLIQVFEEPENDCNLRLQPLEK